MASSVAAAGAAVAFYFYSRRVRLCGFGRRDEAVPVDSSHFEGAYQAPSTWVEALYFFAEALRYMYSESLGRWKTADLLIGLAYLARQGANSAVADIACAGKLVGEGKDKKERCAIVEEFKRIAHFMKYCQALRERRLPAQTVLLARLGIAEEDILMQQAFAGMLKPSYVLVIDRRVRCVVLAIRGTHSVKDMFTSLTSASKPHHMLSGAGVILGYSHFGMLAAARWVLQQTQTTLREAMENSPGYHLQIVGHSLGAGTAALLTTRLREFGGLFSEATCLAIACPACMTVELARSCTSYVTTIINGHDMIPTLSPGAADALREEVTQSSWYEAFRADMRSSMVVRAVEASIGGVGSVTSVASTWTASGLSAASRSFRACYQGQRALPLKRSGSDAAAAAVYEPAAMAGSIQVARDWTNPADEAESPSWNEILQMLEPLEAEADARGVSAEEPLRASWPSTFWNGRWESAAARSEPQRSKPFHRRAGELWSKLWLRGCRVAPRTAPFERIGDEDDIATADSNFDSMATPRPEERMARDSEEAVNDPLSPGGAYRQELRAVQVECDIPDVSLSPPRFGARGDERDVASAFSPSSSPERGILSEEERKWRRMTYPAGRIYHLVPARLVFGARSDREQFNEAESSQSPADGGSPVGSSPRSSDTHGALHEGVTGYERSPKSRDPYIVIQTKGASIGSARGLTAPIPPPEDFVLLEDVPQEVYARIRLCSRMLADHFIPAYLGSLETALKYVEKGYPTMAPTQEL